MIERKEEIGRLGAAVVLIAYDETSLLHAKLLRGVDVPYPILIDRTKAVYRRWGMGRTTLNRSVFSPTLSYRYLKLLLKGEPFLGLAPDMLQLGADFVIDREGRIAFAYYMASNGDRAETEVLIAELRRVAS